MPANDRILSPGHARHCSLMLPADITGEAPQAAHRFAQQAPRLAMVAGEASGDLLAGLLLEGLHARWPVLQPYGIGGPRMAALGFKAHWPHHKLAVRGYVEVLWHLREILGIRRELGDLILKNRPDAFIGVDAPDFNLALETRLKAQGIKTIHFVSPSVWAWRGERVEKMRKAVDEVLCLFPFEPDIYTQQGISATYVGHPLADLIPFDPPQVQSRQILGLEKCEGPVIALLPGSRRSEIAYIAPRLLAAATHLVHSSPKRDWRFIWPVASGLRELAQAQCQQHGGADLPLQLLDGQSHEALAACDVTLIASGTATLEAALFKRPMVITYVMNALSWQLMRRMKYQPWVGLPNILLRDFAVPELLQADATPQALAEAVLTWLENPKRCQAVQARFQTLHQQLRCNTAEAASHAIEKVLAR
jgi:lipid-A-disaccharide synthase